MILFQMKIPFYTVTIDEQKISIVDMRGKLLNPTNTDILINNVASVSVYGLIQRLNVTLRDGTIREIENVYGPNAVKAKAAILSAIK